MMEQWKDREEGCADGHEEKEQREQKDQSRQSGHDHRADLLFLAPELLVHMCSFLDLQSLCVVGAVCRHLRAASLEDRLWVRHATERVADSFGFGLTVEYREIMEKRNNPNSSLSQVTWRELLIKHRKRRLIDRRNSKQIKEPYPGIQWRKMLQHYHFPKCLDHDHTFHFFALGSPHIDIPSILDRWTKEKTILDRLVLWSSNSAILFYSSASLESFKYLKQVFVPQIEEQAPYVLRFVIAIKDTMSTGNQNLQANTCEPVPKRKGKALASSLRGKYMEISVTDDEKDIIRTLETMNRLNYAHLQYLLRQEEAARVGGSSSCKNS